MDRFSHMDSFFNQDSPQITDGKHRHHHSLEAARPSHRHPKTTRPSHHGQSRNQLEPYNYDAPFAHFQDMFSGMQRMMQDSMSPHNSGFSQMESNDPNVHSYCSSSVYSYSNADGGEPKIYQAHRSLRRAPGDVREEQKAMRDSVSGEERMHLGQYIGGRGKRMDKQRNIRTGRHHEDNEYIGFDEADAGYFDQGWRHYNGRSEPNAIGHGGRGTRREPIMTEPYEDFDRTGGRYGHRGREPTAIEYGKRGSRHGAKDARFT